MLAMLLIAVQDSVEDLKVLGYEISGHVRVNQSERD